jgi:hypothetical protein
MPMVTPLELDNPVSPRDPAGQPNGAHSRLSPGVHKSDQLDRGDRLNDHAGQHRLPLGRCAIAYPKRCSLLNRFDDGGVSMADDHRPPGADIVDVAMAIDVVEAAAMCLLDHHRLSTHGLKRTHGAVHPPRQKASGLLKKRFRTRTSRHTTYGRATHGLFSNSRAASLAA